MGRVWVAEHLTLKMQVAVKFILESLVRESPELIDRFNREARTSAQIKSHHVVQVFDHGVMDDGTPFLVMELLEGENLGDRLERMDVLAVPEMATILRQVARALDKAHELGIVHRDIKPDNIFLVTSEEDLLVKVLDFGIAKPVKQPTGKRLTQPGALVGTPEFMSREQVLFGKDDARSDLWALAVVTYLALTGEIPFDGPTVVAICAAIERGEFAPPSSLRPELPPELDGWFAQALHGDPEQRFQSAKEMAIAFLQQIPAALGAGGESWEETGQYASRDLVGASAEATPAAVVDGPSVANVPADPNDEPAVPAATESADESEGREPLRSGPWGTSAGQLRRRARERYGPELVPESQAPPSPAAEEGEERQAWPSRRLWLAGGVIGLAAVVGLALAVSLGGAGGKGCKHDSDCRPEDACVFIEDHAECVPKCGADGSCPLGRSCERCARSGACPHCNTCVPACL